jgi:hypothetical protein
LIAFDEDTGVSGVAVPEVNTTDAAPIEVAVLLFVAGPELGCAEEARMWWAEEAVFWWVEDAVDKALLRFWGVKAICSDSCSGSCLPMCLSL